MSYLIARLSKSTMAWVNGVSTSAQSRTPEFAASLAYVVASNLPMPAQPVESIADYFRLHHYEQVVNELDSVNSLLPHDTKLSEDWTKKFYAYRYDQLFPSGYVLAFRADKGVEDFFGLNKTFNQQLLTLIQTKACEMSHLISMLQRLRQEVLDKAEQKGEEFVQTKFLEAAK